MQGDAAAADDADGHYFFFSAPASPVHYILRSPPSSTAAASSAYFAAPVDADCSGDFEFAAHGAGTHGPGAKGAVAMSSAEELFVAGRIRVAACLSPILHQEDGWEDCGGGGDEEEERERDGRSSPRATRRARSVSPTRSPMADRGAAAFAEPSDAFTSAAASSSSSSAKNIRRRISLRDLLSRTGGDCAGADHQPASSSGEAGAQVTSSRFGFWPSSRSSKKSPPLPCPAAPQPGRRSTSTDRDRGAAVPAAGKRAPPPGGSGRRTTSLPYRHGLVLGCLGFGARGYGLAKSMHPLPSR